MIKLGAKLVIVVLCREMAILLFLFFCVFFKRGLYQGLRF